MQVVAGGEEVRAIKFDSASEVSIVVRFSHAARNINSVVEVGIID